MAAARAGGQHAKISNDTSSGGSSGNWLENSMAAVPCVTGCLRRGASFYIRHHYEEGKWSLPQGHVGPDLFVSVSVNKNTNHTQYSQ